IPYGIDPAIFRPVSKAAVREVLGLPQNARLIFFGSQSHLEKRKGISYLIDALGKLHADLGGPGNPPVMALIAGKSDPAQTAKIPFKSIEVGYLPDDRLLAMGYQAADVFVCPSVDDAGPLMIPESLMCGTPVVAFEVCGGAPDFLINGQNGWRVPAVDASAM